MAAKRISQSAINWAKIVERVPENQKSQFIAFKARSDTYLRRVLAFPEKPPAIDWALYKKHVPIPGMVDTFQKQYEALKVPFPADTVTSKIVEQEQNVKAEIAQFKSESEARIKKYEEQLAYLASLIPFDQMTMEDFRDSYPEIALDPINRPTFWPHDEEEQKDYRDKGHPMHGVNPHAEH